jgi:hypothetical protein
MRRSTFYSASSWGLSVVAHAAALVALARIEPPPLAHASDSGGSREILLLPPPVNPPPAARLPEPVPPKPPEPQPEPPRPELAQKPVVLGIDDGSAQSKNWLGAAVETPHSGPKADQDQAQFSPAPGIPVVGQSSSEASPAQPAPPAPAQPAPAAPAQALPAPEPVESPQSPAPARTPQDQPLREAAPPPPAPRQVVPSKEQPDRPDAKVAEEAAQGVKDAPRTQGAQAPPLRENQADKPDSPPSPEAQPAARPDSTPDGDRAVREAPQAEQAPPAAPPAPEKAAIDPRATPNTEGDPDSPREELLTPRDRTTPDDRPDEPSESMQQAMQELAREAIDATEVPPPGESTPIDPAPPSPADAPPSSPGVNGSVGAPVVGDRPGIESDRESDAAAVKVISADRLGKPLAAKGLNITTVRPRWSTSTMMIASPKNPMVRIEFKRNGRVAEAKFIDGYSTGSIDIDEPLLDAIHRWTAKGKPLEELPPGDRRLVLILRIQLR